MLLRILFTIIIYLFTIDTGKAQTIDEWINQKKTQRKYMLQQIAKLQSHIKAVKEGYDIIKNGLNLIERIKSGDFTLHDLFFKDQYQVKQVLLKHSNTKRCIEVYQQLQSEAVLFLGDITKLSALSTPEKDFISRSVNDFRAALQKEIQALLDVLSNDNLQMSDDDRLKRIQAAYDTILKDKQWLSKTIQATNLLQTRRNKELLDLERLQQQFKK